CCLFSPNIALKRFAMRQHSFTVSPYLSAITKTATHLSRRNFCDNFFKIEADWLAPINEKLDKLAKKGK
ncbi:MAG: hypothetical protein IKE65_00975, partial [Clostridia bacterium]|nr:hypothetical protein [Clostridia bacterium]